MRTFSQLRRHCAAPEVIDAFAPRPYHLNRAAGMGNGFHSAVERWVKGEPYEAIRAELQGDVLDWFERLRANWAPPHGCGSEIALGLSEEDGQPRADVALEPEPHVYEPLVPMTFVTAGRLDLLWVDAKGVLCVCDLKTGKSYLGEPWEVPQLVAQGLAACLYTKSKKVRVGAYYARLGMFDWGETLSASAVVKRWDDVRNWATMSNEPRPGPWCLACYKSTSDNCDANPAKKRAA